MEVGSKLNNVDSFKRFQSIKYCDLLLCACDGCALVILLITDLITQ